MPSVCRDEWLLSGHLGLTPSLILRSAFHLYGSNVRLRGPQVLDPILDDSTCAGGAVKLQGRSQRKDWRRSAHRTSTTNGTVRARSVPDGRLDVGIGKGPKDAYRVAAAFVSLLPACVSDSLRI